MGFKQKVFKVGLFVMIVAILPGLPPYPTFPFKSFSVTPPRPLEDILAPNQLLNNAEHLLEHQLASPDTILVRGNMTYVTVYGGKILELTNDEQIRVVAKFGKECRSHYDDRECGRVLGMAFDSQGNNLIVIEAYSGIWQVQIKTGEKKQLISLDTVIEGGKVSRKPKFPNALAVARNGDIYWSDFSSDFLFEDAMIAMLMNPSGRLVHYSRATGKSKVLIDEVYGANGIVLNADESFVLVGETGGQLIYRYYLKGSKSGTYDIFADGLPGSVDNLMADENGIWVGIVIAADPNNPSALALLAPFPILRKFCVRMLTFIELPFEFVYQKTGNQLALHASHFIGNLLSAKALFPKRSTVLRLDWEGNIVAALHGDDGTASLVAHATQNGEYLLLGSPATSWIGRVRLNEETLKTVGSKVRLGSAKKPSPKPVIVDKSKQKVDGEL
ncbi:adipocyte plasma membrane-associated protein Hemomucin-like isoform X1 [Malaya genurostris]|uniref:adipocyte plasma membrane-associated protein Hemomucin-like isoform X1 n=1 Tax=Malaya genurostris TaxID=325434 RepID=UPI0026F37F8D|nr:adipocyte plasma membrane-associated protein Hemomucin-like isoform X1 [Malaya genurostris]XP_058453226.1 adipocyte plasma membrane-associated protein Hemomucin-like isoform X1 [Malaya genurostris]XP_058453233.1 adipocyte plasma membrane-associated protein Hemomucin-like isoform X1 [Malaya genurostris]XP_058453241.1 adipocyte plasma membrane-associated protein Hemomucin-like isoform X1 [Malaya genurostris]XP_058453250.1 adipocyte plasma membrane-associated protein Hemomucin-like isoform X1 [